MEFDAERKGTGTAEWAEVTENIQIGCANNCLYCYAAHKAATMYGGWCKREGWANERLTKRANMPSYPARDGVVMFPATHDITPFNLEASIRVLKLILKKGNRVLIVTKPRMDCVNAMLEDLAPWKEQILFRFTIGSMNDATCYFWEPGAPSPQERLACLANAYEAGFKTSVSAEPLLGGIDTATGIIEEVGRFVTDTIWIGKMNKIRLRVPVGYEKEIEHIERLQRDEFMLVLFNRFKDDHMIRWKDSIKEILARSRGGL